jgi:regulatory protein
VAEYIIAGLEPVKRKKGWFELIFKGKPPFYIDDETIIKNSLVIGQIVSEAGLKRIKEEADKAWLKYRAIQILSRRMISERDLRRKLSAERRPSPLRDQVLTQLREYGYIDDLKYASSYIRSQIAHGGKSRLYLKKKLFEKGISSDAAESALVTELAGYDEESSALELARKKAKSLDNEPTLKAKQKLASFLRSRGYGWDSINRAIRVLINNKKTDA